jgi:hypothetical protein
MIHNSLEFVGDFLNTLTNTVAYSLSLDRDGALWSLPSDLVEQRSSAFWTVFHASTWQVREKP